MSIMNGYMDIVTTLARFNGLINCVSEAGEFQQVWTHFYRSFGGYEMEFDNENVVMKFVINIPCL